MINIEMIIEENVFPFLGEKYIAKRDPIKQQFPASDSGRRDTIQDTI
jgi:hypothetical protein